jgi:hypothetical protein
MRIALIGDFGSRPDEGMRKICHQTEAVVRCQHEVMTVSPKRFCIGRAWRGLRRFNPDCLTI